LGDGRARQPDAELAARTVRHLDLAFPRRVQSQRWQFNELCTSGFSRATIQPQLVDPLFQSLGVEPQAAGRFFDPLLGRRLGGKFPQLHRNPPRPPASSPPATDLPLRLTQPGSGRTARSRSHRLSSISCVEEPTDSLSLLRERFMHACRNDTKFDALIIDDLGYVQQSREEMEVLFTLLAERYERGSVMLTSNLPFSKWEQIFKDAMTTAAAIDRLVHHSIILELNVPSYRLEKAKRQDKESSQDKILSKEKK
jgi:hypothetical protein